MTMSTYPVHVDAHLDPGLSRWLWLVKWLLTLPHYIVLAFLWPAFAVLSVIAFFAILFTGHYPRSIFDFNVGVLRWTWRVTYYAYGALGSDRYPPFSLSEVPDYPAHLEIDYPEHLSRGLVLVKWWLLAIPHYIVLGFLLGGGLYITDRATSADAPWGWGGGLIGFLVLVAAIALMFTGRYPQSIFDLVLGLNRWVLRVAAYAGLMTDRYPPFRLDMGEDEQVDGRLTMGATATASAPPASAVDAAAPQAATASSPSPSSWTGGRIASVVIASLMVVMSLGFAAGGTALLVVDQTARDDAGFLMSDDDAFSTSTYAIATESMELRTAGAADSVPEALIGDTKVTVVPSGDTDVFVGIARTADVSEFFAGVAFTTVTDLATGDNGALDPVYQDSPGGVPNVLPDDVDIWAASSSGPGSQTVVWEPEDGDWTVVVMNADGAPTVDVDASAGATVPMLTGLMIGLFVVAGILLAGAVLMLILAIPKSRPLGAPRGGQPAGA